MSSHTRAENWPQRSQQWVLGSNSSEKLQNGFFVCKQKSEYRALFSNR